MKKYTISSPQNDVFKKLVSLLGSGGINEHGQAIIAGRKAVAELLNAQKDRCLGIIYPDGDPEKGNAAIAGASRGLTEYALKKNLFDQLDLFGTGQPLLLMQVPSILKWEPSLKLPGCSLYLPFQDPANIGAVLRSAAAFGVRQIILGEGSAHPFHPKSARASSGNLFTHHFYRSKGQPDFSDQVTVVLDLKGEDVSLFEFPKDFILIPGMEGPGLSGAVSQEPTHRINIRIDPAVESLNAVVAASIALFCWRQST
jgi:tRNA G18 (ribose-2'-O)-methylase SpoU